MLSVSCRYFASLIIVDDTRNDRRLVIEESSVESMAMAMAQAKMRRILRRLDSELSLMVSYMGKVSNALVIRTFVTVFAFHSSFRKW